MGTYVVVARTVIPSLDEDGCGGSSGNELSVGKALEQAYQWLEYSERFAAYVEERSRHGMHVSMCFAFLIYIIFILRSLFIKSTQRMNSKYINIFSNY